MPISTTNRVAGSIDQNVLALLNLINDQYVAGKVPPSTALKRLAISKLQIANASALRDQLDKAAKTVSAVRSALAAKVAEHTERPASAETLATDIIKAKESELEEHRTLNEAAAAADKIVGENAAALGFSVARPAVVEEKPVEKPVKKVNPLLKNVAAFVQKSEALASVINAAAIDPDLKPKEAPKVIEEEASRGDFKTKPVLLLESNEYVIVQMASETVARQKGQPVGAAMASLKDEFDETTIIEAHRVVYEQAQAQRKVSLEASDEAVKYCEAVIKYIAEIDEIDAAEKNARAHFGNLLPAAQKPTPTVARRQ